MRCSGGRTEEDGAFGAGDAVILIRFAAFTLGFRVVGGASVTSPTPFGIRPPGPILPFGGKGEKMRICVPTEGNGGLDDRVGEHFGRSPTYTIYDTETGEVEILPNTSEHLGGQGLPAELLAQAGVDVVLCAGLGRRAMALLSQYGIEVHTGASGTVREAIQAWQAGRLSGAEPCERHLFHEH